MKFRTLYSCAVAALFAIGVTSAHAIDPNALPDTHPGSKSDNAAHPLGKKQADMRVQGLHKLLKGQAQAQGSNKVVQVAKGQFVELARQGEDKIFTVVGQFGPLDSPFNVLKSGIAGPVRNQIPQPDRTSDNTTIWAPDFNQAYYTEPAVLRHAGRGLDAQFLYRAIVEPLHRQRRRHRLGAGAL